MESKTKRNARLKALRRKYGLGEFSSNKKRKARTTKKRASKKVVRMARRKYATRRRSRGGMNFVSLAKKAVGGVGAATLVGQGGLVGAVAGYATNGIVGAVAAYAAPQITQFTNNMTKGMLGSGSAAGSASPEWV